MVTLHYYGLVAEAHSLGGYDSLSILSSYMYM